MSAPGARVRDAADTKLSVTGRFVGLFATYGVGGAYEGPTGKRTLSAQDPSERFLGTAPGTYRVHLEPSAGAGPYAYRYYLQGADMPNLGLYRKG